MADQLDEGLQRSGAVSFALCGFLQATGGESVVAQAVSVLQ